MAQSIFSLFGEVFVNTEKADESLSKTEEKAGGVGEKLGSGIKTAAKWGAAIVGGATAAVTGMVNFAEKTAATADEVDKMSQRLGISREAYQEMDFVLSQSGVDINSFQTGMKSLLKNMDAVTEGNKTATENFKLLGVEVTNTDGTMKSQEEVLFETIKAFQGMENSAEKSRLAQELFGKQGQEILPLLNSESGSLEEMRKQAHDLGLVMGDDLIDAGVELTDTMDQTKRAFGAIVTQLGGALMPLVTKAAQDIQGYLPTIQQMITTLAPVLASLFEQLVPPLMNLVDSLLPVLSQLILTLTPIISDLLTTLTPIISDILSALLPLLTPILQAIGELIQTLLPPLSDILKALMPLLEPILELLGTLIKAILPVVTEQVKLMAQAFSTVLGVALNAITPIIQNVQNILDGLIQFVTGVFTGNWQQAWEGVVKIFSNVFDGLKNIVKAPLNAVIDLINKVFENIGEIDIPDWVPGIGGKTFSMPKIPKLAKGGTITASGTAIVGEAGAEMINLPVGAKVTPLTENGIEEKLNAVLDMMTQYMPLIGRGSVYLDKRVLVGQITPDINNEMGRLSERRV